MSAISLNVDFSGVSPIASGIKLKQFERGAAEINFNILKDGSVWDPSEEYSEATIRFIRADGRYNERYLWKKGDSDYAGLTVTSSEGNAVSAELRYLPDLFEIFKPGTLELQLAFISYDESGNIGKKPLSPIIMLDVYKSLSSYNIDKESWDLIDAILSEAKALQVTVTSDEYVDKLEKCIADFNSFKNQVHIGETTYDPMSSKAQSGKAVAEAIAAIVNSAPETLNTLEELAAALGDDPNFATTVMSLIGTKASKEYVDKICVKAAKSGKGYVCFNDNIPEERDITIIVSGLKGGSGKYLLGMEEWLNEYSQGEAKIVAEITGDGVYTCKSYACGVGFWIEDADPSVAEAQGSSDYESMTIEYEKYLSDSELVDNEKIKIINDVLDVIRANAVILADKLDAKADKVEGKGLSQNDYTNADKAMVTNADTMVMEHEESIGILSDNLSEHGDDKNNPHSVTKEQIGLGNVDNTSDMDKPVSTAVQAALDDKIDQGQFINLDERVTKNEDTITSLSETKVDKVEGKGLSSNDFTDEDISNLKTLRGDMDYFIGYAMDLDTQIHRNMDDIAALNPAPITTIPTTLEVNKKYNFGEVTELGLVFPTTANDGDVIYITFTSGETATTLTVDTTNTCDIELIPETNTYYEVFGSYNGAIWLVNYSEYVVSGV